MPPEERWLFELEDPGPGRDEKGERFAPTSLCRGPWYPGTQHGSPVLGLLARAVESVPAERPVQVVRLTADLMRAAPLASVSVRARLRRGGKHVEYVDASLRADGEEYARATAMRIRRSHVPVPEAVDDRPAPPAPALPPDDGGMGWPAAPRTGEEEGLHHALEMRPEPGFASPTLWLRMRHPLVRGETPSPLVRVAVAADFTYPVVLIRRMQLDPAFLGRQPYSAINPDTTLNLHRPLHGEWVCIHTRAWMDSLGAATAGARLYDVRGPVGLASQSLLVRSAGAAPGGWRRYARERRSPSSGDASSRG